MQHDVVVLIGLSGTIVDITSYRATFEGQLCPDLMVAAREGF